MSGMYSQFELNNNLVEEGVEVDYGSFKVLLAHSGAGNKKWNAAVESVFKPVRRAIDQGLLGEDRAKALLYPVYASHIIKGWWVNKGTDDNGNVIWEKGIEQKDGSVAEFNISNVVSTFKNLPALFTEMKSVSDSMEQYRLADLKADAKN